MVSIGRWPDQSARGRGGERNGLFPKKSGESLNAQMSPAVGMKYLETQLSDREMKVKEGAVGNPN